MNLDSYDLKKNCAKVALKYIKNDTIIGLGGGTTISYLVEYIKNNKNLNVKVATPSFKTKMLCIQNGIEVVHTCSISNIDVAFDGCDEVDEGFNALKSGGGIHTNEKLIASMADEYILLVDNTKFVKSLTFKQPVVLEISKDSLKYVEKKVKEIGGKPILRSSSAKDGFTVTDNGNLLMDVMVENVTDTGKLQNILKNICGVVETSLFTKEVTKVFVAFEDGIKMISKN